MRLWRRVPDNEFTRQGFEVVPGFLDTEECERLVSVVLEHERETSTQLADGAYFLQRAQISDAGTDLRVGQLFHAHRLDPVLEELARERTFETMFEERLGVAMELDSITVQIDDVDTESKRGFHVDRIAPLSCKAFVYLTDVDDVHDGPYTVVPGTHRRVVARVLRALAAYASGGVKTDQRVFGGIERGWPVLGRRGTLILSCQQLIHRGHPAHDRRRRVVLIAYLVRAGSARVDDPPFGPDGARAV